MKNVEEVAKELGVSKTAIYNKLKITGYKEKAIKKNGKTMINDELYELLKENIKIKTIERTEERDKNEEHEKSEEADGETIKRELDEVIDEESDKLIMLLMDQLKQKDKQIDRLHGLIENSQVLIKNEQAKSTEALKLQEHFDEVDRKLLELREGMAKEKEKKGFFTGLFKKKK